MIIRQCLIYLLRFLNYLNRFSAKLGVSTYEIFSISVFVIFFLNIFLSVDKSTLTFIFFLKLLNDLEVSEKI